MRQEFLLEVNSESQTRSHRDHGAAPGVDRVRRSHVHQELVPRAAAGYPARRGSMACVAIFLLAFFLLADLEAHGVEVGWVLGRRFFR